MTETTAPQPRKSLLGLPRIVWAAFAISLMASMLCFLVVGPTLGLFFGGIVIATTLLPAMSLASPLLVDRLLIATAINDGIGVVWLVPIFGSGPTISIMQFLVCYALLIGWCVALVGLAHLLSRLMKDPTPAAALVVLVAMAWLTCPIWLPSGADRLVSFHPLFALNGVLRQLGTWTERPIAYRYLFTLGQDVPYELPRSIVPCTAVHLLVGLAALGLGRVIGRK